MGKNTTVYDNESIKALKDEERVRLRPSVIFGSDGISGCEHSIFEIISNSIDEAREGYGHKGRRPSGSCVLEARGNEGKFSCFAQDLRPETLYSIYALFPDGERYAGMPLGPLAVDANGKSQQRVSFAANNILNGRYMLSDCAGIVVLVSRAAEPTSPLCGYNGSPVSWRKRFYDGTIKGGLRTEWKEPDAQSSTPVRTESTPMPPITVRLTEPKQVATEAPYITPLKQTAPEAPPVTMRPVEPSPPSPVLIRKEPNVPPVRVENAPPATEPQPMISHIETAAPSRMRGAGINPPTANTSGDFPPSAANTPGNFPPPPVSELMAQAERIFASYPNESPFKRQNRSAKWVKVTSGETPPAPVNAPGLFSDPFISGARELHGHILLGMTDGAARNQYIIGVPDKYDPANRMKANALGFTQFKPCDDVRISRGQFGYWLMFVNL